MLVLTAPDCNAADVTPPGVYRINLTRPVKAGIYKMVCSNEDTLDCTYTNGSTERTEETKFVTEGTLKLYGRSKADTTFGTLYLRKCQSDGLDLLASGTRLDIINGAPGTYHMSVKGKAVTADTVKLIKDVLPIVDTGANPLSDAAMFNPGVGQTIGNTWKINPAKFVKSKKGIIAGTVKGQARLVSVTELSGEPVCDVQLYIDYDAMNGTNREKVTQSYLWKFPVAPDTPMYRRDCTINASYTNEDEGVKYTHKQVKSLQFVPTQSVNKPVVKENPLPIDKPLTDTGTGATTAPPGTPASSEPSGATPAPAPTAP